MKNNSITSLNLLNIKGDNTFTYKKEIVNAHP